MIPMTPNETVEKVMAALTQIEEVWFCIIAGFGLGVLFMAFLHDWEIRRRK